MYDPITAKEFQHHMSIDNDEVTKEINIGFAEITLTCEDSLVHWAVAIETI